MVRRLALGLVAAAALLLSGCTGSDTPAATGVTGPLCDSLPTGDDPGNPASLTGEPADKALQWIPVLTTFEAAVRASGLLPELTAKPGITLLAPSDDAFAAKFSETNLDNLMLKDKDSLRTLVRAHVVDRPLSLAELRDGGEVTTMDGTKVRVAAAGAMALIGGEAQTVCADYRMANGRIHVINHVLGNLPTTAGQDSDEDH
jgi:uncharacterized surface protein with fasciclin (FAS1) repeats